MSGLTWHRVSKGAQPRGQRAGCKPRVPSPPPVRRSYIGCASPAGLASRAVEHVPTPQRSGRPCMWAGCGGPHLTCLGTTPKPRGRQVRGGSTPHRVGMDFSPGRIAILEAPVHATMTRRGGSCRPYTPNTRGQHVADHPGQYGVVCGRTAAHAPGKAQAKGRPVGCHGNPDPPQRGAAGPWHSWCGGYWAHSRERLRARNAAPPRHVKHGVNIPLRIVIHTNSLIASRPAIPFKRYHTTTP